MTAHDCTELTPGCYRCDLNRDEIEAQRQEVERERRMLAEGNCPRTGKRIMPDGRLRPACAICDCGEE